MINNYIFFISVEKNSFSWLRKKTGLTIFHTLEDCKYRKTKKRKKRRKKQEAINENKQNKHETKPMKFIYIYIYIYDIRKNKKPYMKINKIIMKQNLWNKTKIRKKNQNIQECNMNNNVNLTLLQPKNPIMSPLVSNK